MKSTNLPRALRKGKEEPPPPNAFPPWEILHECYRKWATTRSDVIQEPGVDIKKRYSSAAPRTLDHIDPRRDTAAPRTSKYKGLTSILRSGQVSGNGLRREATKNKGLTSILRSGQVFGDFGEASGDFEESGG